jgi:hypothetical protein
VPAAGKMPRQNPADLPCASRNDDSKRLGGGCYSASFSIRLLQQLYPFVLYIQNIQHTQATVKALLGSWFLGLPR